MFRLILCCNPLQIAIGVYNIGFWVTEPFMLAPTSGARFFGGLAFLVFLVFLVPLEHLALLELLAQLRSL